MAKLTVTIDSENPYVKVESIHSGITAVKSVTVDFADCESRFGTVLTALRLQPLRHHLP